MQRRWLPIICLALVVAFLAGLSIGAAAESSHQSDRQIARAAIQTTIAVVNADVGAMVDNMPHNYSAAIIDTLGSDFVLVSPMMAYTGYNTGIYGAIITFPADVSERILSFNSDRPEQVRLEFQINPNLPEREFLETYTRIIDLQTSINTTLAYTYVHSIFGQFHLAQDQVQNIFQNNQDNISALDTVYMQRFTTLLQLDELPWLPLNPNPAVTDHHLLSVTDFAERVSYMYLSSYQAASEDYIEMRRGLIQLTDNFPQQQDEWLGELSDWTNISVEYGRELMQYTSDILEHISNLEYWHDRASSWNYELADYQSEVEDWHDRLNIWHDELDDWYEQYWTFLVAAQEYVELMEEHSIELFGEFNDALDALAQWHDGLTAYATQLLQRADQHDLHVISANQAWVGLANWHQDLEQYRSGFVGLETYMTGLINLYISIEMIPPLPALTGDPAEDGPALAAWRSSVSGVGSQMDMFISNNQWGDLNGILQNVPQLSTNFTHPDDLTLFGWDGSTIGPVPAAVDISILPDPIDNEFAQADLPPAPNAHGLPGYTGEVSPEMIENPPRLEAVQPSNPLVDPPPRPDAFWASLNSMHSQLMSFDIEDYLTPQYRQQVERMLWDYEVYLGTIRADLSSQFDRNIHMLLDVRHGYTDFLSDLRIDALQAEADNIDQLQHVMRGFYTIVGGNNMDTHGRLADFSAMMPESRTPIGINSDVTMFTVAPFEFVSPGLRESMAAQTATASAAQTYMWYLWIVVLILGVAVLLSYVVSYFRRTRKQS